MGALAAPLWVLLLTLHPAEGLVSMHPGGDSCAQLLARLGHVQYQFYPRAGHVSYGGTTDFHLDYSYSTTYTYAVRSVGDSASLMVHPRATAHLTLAHVVHLPRGLNDRVPWYRRLRLHEFDHVSISSDERPRLLFRYMVMHLPVIHAMLSTHQPVTSTLINRLIRDRIQERHAAVVRLIQGNYDLLDRVTAHGTIPLEDRAAFFDSLYSVTRLEDREFRFLDEVREMMSSDRYRNALRFHCD